MTYLPAFQSWLSQHGYSQATIRNYLVDVNKYLEFSAANSDDISQIFTTELVGLYIDHLSHNTNSQRYLASISLFCQFAVDQHLLNENPVAQIRKKIHQKHVATPLEELRNHKNSFSIYLTKHQNSPTTIKNYINDVEQYISWLEAQNFGSQ